MSPYVRSLLLLTTSLTLISCDDKDTSSQTATEQTTMVAPNTTGIFNATPEPTISGNFLAGQFAQGHSDWDHAANFFDNVHDLDPDAPGIESRIMALSLGSGNYTRAITLAKKLSEEKGTNDPSLTMLLAALEPFKNKDYNETLRLLEKSPDSGLGITVIPLFKAWANAGLGKTDVAALIDKPTLTYQAVVIAAYTKDKKTISDLAKTIDFTKTQTPVHNLEDMVTIFALNGETKAARDILIALKNALPQREALYTKRLAALDKGDLSIFTTPVTSPQQAYSNALISVAQLLSNSYPDYARIFAHMATYLQPTDEAALELLAQIAADDNQYDEAISYLARIPSTPDVEKTNQIQRQIALLLQQSDKDDEAIRILQGIVDTSKNVDAQIQIGDIYRGKEKYAEALTAYNAAEALLHNNVPQKHWDLLFARGMVNERLQKWDDAEKDLKMALSYEPDQPYILNYLGYSWTDQGKNLDKAAEMIEKAVRLKPDDGAIVDSLGWVYFRMGNFDRAVRTLEKAIEISPTEAEINDHLGDAYWRVGRKNEAKFQWKRAISFTTDKDVIAKITKKLDVGLPDISSMPPAKMVENN